MSAAELAGLVERRFLSEAMVYQTEDGVWEPITEADDPWAIALNILRTSLADISSDAAPRRGGRWFSPSDLRDVRVVLEAAECGWVSGEAISSVRRLHARLLPKAVS